MFIYTPESQEQLWKYLLECDSNEAASNHFHESNFEPYAIFEQCLDFLSRIPGFKYKKIRDTINQFYRLLEKRNIRIIDTDDDTFIMDVIIGDHELDIQWIVGVPGKLSDQFGHDPISSLNSILYICVVLVVIITDYHPRVQKYIQDSSPQMHFPKLKAFTQQQLLLQFVQRTFEIDVREAAGKLLDIQTTVSSQYN
jgi:hypothetical protein